MTAIPFDLSSEYVLKLFVHDSPFLFIGAAFMSVGLIAALFTLVRRKPDALLFYFAGFAALYGLRLWLQSDIVKLLMANSWVFPRFVAAVDYAMPVPALLFMSAAGLLRSLARTVLYGYGAIGLALAIAAGAFGNSSRLGAINQIAGSIALLILVVDLVKRWRDADTDLRAIRRGLILFVAFALAENLAGVFSLHMPKVEPLGFAVFLGSLGYVAARRTLSRETQFNELQKELDVARRIQLSILPSAFPISNHFSVAARYVPMTSVAGDFYDYVVTQPTRAGLLIADVSGHGVPAALIASMVKLAAASQSPSSGAPAKFMAGMNGALCGNTQGQFVTAAYVYLDAEARTMRYSAAGHPPMLLVRGRAVEPIEENGLILAAFDFAAYSELSLPLESGDRLFLYTDGVLEASDGTGEFFGRERLASLLAETAEMTASEAAEIVVTRIKNWSPVQEDDLTVMVCDFRA